MTKYALKEMKKRNYGRILLFASIAGKEVIMCAFRPLCDVCCAVIRMQVVVAGSTLHTQYR